MPHSHRKWKRWKKNIGILCNFLLKMIVYFFFASFLSFVCSRYCNMVVALSSLFLFYRFALFVYTVICLQFTVELFVLSSRHKLPFDWSVKNVERLRYAIFSFAHLLCARKIKYFVIRSDVLQSEKCSQATVWSEWFFFSYRWEIKMEKRNRKWEKIPFHISTTTFKEISVENQT